MQDAQWWYANSKQSEGPVDLAGLRRLQQDGTVTARTLMWREGMASWRPLAELDPSVAPMDPTPPSIEPAQAVSASGASTADPSDPYRAPAASPVAATAPQLEGDIALYAAVVGGNFPIYRQRWRLDQGIADGNGNGNGTWHWPAFLIGVIWMVYRRMYRLAAIWAGVLVFFSIAEALLGVPEGVSTVITLVINITAAVYANRWYLAHCQREIARARALVGDDGARLRSELARRGDTNALAAAVVAIAVVAVMLVGQALAG
ncbi:hypothetical protein B9Y88_21825 [Stenotrophomonas maltophilia]|uniref:GYF domain-containing protein n=1 Tax=Stenotrophomonas TaxID=40323 RepID=UPI000C2599B5|nr:MULTISPECIES: DUF2628 domain-containing protein [unclassified Stenotrophomonas]MCU1059250.1 DUF2628 domain-containing protein [Stenotrophomonas maltophilia]MDH1246537.1 GYF domain-containing protein [Stenotrophomonas sp. GD03948]MDH1580677.1 GYF domain-containing protein [Stenotrophomonas sp. GD03744]PJL75423.1 hypothetical protein B9Y88_21825 [Stenotrophomonas maltophilia]PZT29890.1 hypothetical protein A7X94_20330 [Stenotrophomonas maltophilia]